MANTNKPYGLRLVGTIGGGAPSLAIKRFRIPAADSTATFIGDLVTLDVETSVESSGLATPGYNQVDGTAYVKRGDGADNGKNVGVIVGFAFDPTNLQSPYRLASTDRDCFVCVDPNALYEAQSDSTGVTANQINMNALVTMTAGDTTTGVSKAVIASPAADASYPVLLQGFVRDPSNDIASAGYVRVFCKINNHQYANGALGV